MGQRSSSKPAGRVAERQAGRASLAVFETAGYTHFTCPLRAFNEMAIPDLFEDNGGWRRGTWGAASLAVFKGAGFDFALDASLT
jgi:hypothetical protein